MEVQKRVRTISGGKRNQFLLTTPSTGRKITLVFNRKIWWFTEAVAPTVIATLDIMKYSFSQILAAILCFAMFVFVSKHIYRSLVPDKKTKKKPTYDHNDELVTVANFDLAFDAERAKSLLESYDLNAFVMDSNVIGLNQALTWAAGGVRLQAPLRQASQAQKVLHESGFQSLTDLKNYHHCPNCQSTNITCHGLTKLQMLTAVLFFGALLLFLKRDYSCNVCHHDWSS